MTATATEIEHAALAASLWWVDTIKSGIWDNGDAETERCHRAFSSMRKEKPTEEQIDAMGDHVRRLLLEKWRVVNPAYERIEIYADYGCHELDLIAEQLGIPFNSTFDGPQKAGTIIQRDIDTGDVIAKAKSGYRAPWKTIWPTTPKETSHDTEATDGPARP